MFFDADFLNPDAPRRARRPLVADHVDDSPCVGFVVFLLQTVGRCAAPPLSILLISVGRVWYCL